MISSKSNTQPTHNNRATTNSKDPHTTTAPRPTAKTQAYIQIVVQSAGGRFIFNVLEKYLHSCYVSVALCATKWRLALPVHGPDLCAVVDQKLCLRKLAYRIYIQKSDPTAKN
jgi:hypothetical protein